MATLNRLVSLALTLAVSGGVGCGDGDDEDSLVPLRVRRGAVLVDGCTLDGWQQATLASSTTRQVISEVVLRCVSLREDGSLTHADATSRDDLLQLVSDVRGMGYQVSLAITAHDDNGKDFAPAKLLGILQDGTQRGRATAALTALAPSVNAIDLALPPLPDSGRATLTQWIGELALIRPATHLGLFVPPSTETPSDVPGGGAVDLAAIAPSLDRLRLMTLDYSTDDSPGPTTDSEWIYNVATLAAGQRGNATASFDIALPLYGIDFSARGQRIVSYTEAVGLAQSNSQQLNRASGDQSLTFSWLETDQTQHQTWFEDASTIVEFQRQIDTNLDRNDGILYYGLGYEDPALFAKVVEQR